MTNTQLLSHICFVSCVVWELQPRSWNFGFIFHHFLEKSKKGKKIILGNFENLSCTIELMRTGGLRQTIDFIWPDVLEILKL